MTKMENQSGTLLGSNMDDKIRGIQIGWFAHLPATIVTMNEKSRQHTTLTWQNINNKFWLSGLTQLR